MCHSPFLKKIHFGACIFIVVLYNKAPGCIKSQVTRNTVPLPVIDLMKSTIESMFCINEHARTGDEKFESSILEINLFTMYESILRRSILGSWP
eukprot:COSAG01_NODE_9661_length_2377_cov_1.574627_2_plen_94_part_00